MVELSTLERFNQHWATGKVSEELAKPFKRKFFSNILTYLEKRQMLVLIGLRRVGKSVLIFQTIQHLLQKGIKPKNILYFSFDEEKVDLKEVLETYEKNVLMKNFSSLKERIFIFLDEVHYSKGWEGKIKTFYDLYPKIKFFVSGSASLIIEKSLREKLAGRFFSLLIDPLDFREFLRMKKFEIGKFDFDFRKLKEVYLKQSFVLPLFIDYLKKGGFPEIVEEENEKIMIEYVKNSVIDRVIFKDLVFLIRKKDFELFEKILKLVCYNPGMLTNYSKIGRNLGRDRRTISNYFHFLKYALLLYQTFNFRKGGVSLRKLSKSYVYSTGIIFSLNPPSFKDKESISHVVENIIVIFSKAKHYWRKNKNEVDIILERNGNLIPIEVKYRKGIEKKDLGGVLKFLKNYNQDLGIVVSEEKLKKIKIKRKKIWIIPAWLFLLTDFCSNS